VVCKGFLYIVVDIVRAEGYNCGESRAADVRHGADVGFFIDRLIDYVGLSSLYS